MSIIPNIKSLEQQASAAIESGDPADARLFEQACGMQPGDFQAQLQAQGAEQLALSVQAHQAGQVERNAILLGQKQEAMAEQALEAYNFGEGVSVAGASGWEYYAAGHERACAVYFDKIGKDGKETPFTQLGFTVRYDPQTGAIAEAFADDAYGRVFGFLPEGQLEKLNADSGIVMAEPLAARAVVVQRFKTRDLTGDSLATAARIAERSTGAISTDEIMKRDAISVISTTDGWAAVDGDQSPQSGYEGQYFEPAYMIDVAYCVFGASPEEAVLRYLCVHKLGEFVELPVEQQALAASVESSVDADARILLNAMLTYVQMPGKVDSDWLCASIQRHAAGLSLCEPVPDIAMLLAENPSPDQNGSPNPGM